MKEMNQLNERTQDDIAEKKRQLEFLESVAFQRKKAACLAMAYNVAEAFHEPEADITYSMSTPLIYGTDRSKGWQTLSVELSFNDEKAYDMMLMDEKVSTTQDTDADGDDVIMLQGVQSHTYNVGDLELNFHLRYKIRMKEEDEELLRLIGKIEEVEEYSEPELQRYTAVHC